MFARMSVSQQDNSKKDVDELQETFWRGGTCDWKQMIRFWFGSRCGHRNS